MCNCVQELNKKLSKQMGLEVEGFIANIELFSNKTFSTFEYRQGKKNKLISIMHTYCPICGRNYDVGVQP